MPAGVDPQNTLVIDTTKGRVVIKLRTDLAPKHAERLKTLAREGYYDNVPFHRVMDGFMAQTGDGQKFDGTGRSKYPNLAAEFTQTPFKRGVVGMARANDPNSANSQFFICFADASFLNGQYTVIGEVVSGMDVVDKLKKAPPGSQSGGRHRSRQDGEGAGRRRREAMTVRRAGAMLGGVVAVLAAILSFAHAGDLDGPAHSIQPVKRIPFTADLGRGKPPTQELNTIRDVHDAFFACWKAPAKEEARSGTEINIVFSLSRSGEIIGEPRFTVTPLEMSAEVRAIYQRSVDRSLPAVLAVSRERVAGQCHCRQTAFPSPHRRPGPTKDLEMASNPENTLKLETTKGNVVIEMRPDLAPGHVARIKELVREGFYDGIVFHRVIDGFMAQTGCPQGTGTGGSGKKLKAEFNAEPHVRGTVSMARAQNPDSGDSQFFICFDDAASSTGNTRSGAR